MLLLTIRKLINISMFGFLWLCLTDFLNLNSNVVFEDVFLVMVPTVNNMESTALSLSLVSALPQNKKNMRVLSFYKQPILSVLLIFSFYFGWDISCPLLIFPFPLLGIITWCKIAGFII